jgi:hypothetical protein
MPQKVMTSVTEVVWPKKYFCKGYNGSPLAFSWKCKKKSKIDPPYCRAVNFAYQRRVYQCLFVYFGLFRNSSVSFGCFDMDSKHRNEPKQTEKINWLVSRNKPKINRNRFSFGLFRFEPKIYFVCFEDTLLVPVLLLSRANSWYPFFPRCKIRCLRIISSAFSSQKKVQMAL